MFLSELSAIHYPVAAGHSRGVTPPLTSATFRSRVHVVTEVDCMNNGYRNRTARPFHQAIKIPGRAGIKAQTRSVSNRPRSRTRLRSRIAAVPAKKSGAGFRDS